MPKYAKVVMQPHTEADEEAGVVSKFYGIDKSQLLCDRKIIATAVSLHKKQNILLATHKLIK